MAASKDIQPTSLMWPDEKNSSILKRLDRVSFVKDWWVTKDITAWDYLEMGPEYGYDLYYALKYY